MQHFVDFASATFIWSYVIESFYLLAGCYNFKNVIHTNFYSLINCYGALFRAFFVLDFFNFALPAHSLTPNAMHIEEIPINFLPPTETHSALLSAISLSLSKSSKMHIGGCIAANRINNHQQHPFLLKEVCEWLTCLITTVIVTSMLRLVLMFPSDVGFYSHLILAFGFRSIVLKANKPWSCTTFTYTVVYQLDEQKTCLLMSRQSFLTYVVARVTCLRVFTCFLYVYCQYLLWTIKKWTVATVTHIFIYNLNWTL